VLSVKQKKFADEYIKTGNATQSYLGVYQCKLKTAEANSSALLSKTKVREYIDETNIALTRATIADMTEVKEFWTSTLRDKENDHKDRLKASEYIAKTNAAFIDKVEQSGTLVTKVERMTQEELEAEIKKYYE